MVWQRVFRVYVCSHLEGVQREISKILSWYSQSIYTTIAQTRNINIEASSQLLHTTCTEKRFYQYNKFLLDRYQYFDDLYQSSSILSSLHYLCLLNEFSDTRRSRFQLSAYLTPKLPPTSCNVYGVIREVQMIVVFGVGTQLPCRHVATRHPNPRVKEGCYLNSLNFMPLKVS